MLTKKIVLRAAGASLAAIISLAAQPLGAQTPSESERLPSARSSNCNTAMPSWNRKLPV